MAVRKNLPGRLAIGIFQITSLPLTDPKGPISFEMGNDTVAQTGYKVMPQIFHGIIGLVIGFARPAVLTGPGIGNGKSAERLTGPPPGGEVKPDISPDTVIVEREGGCMIFVVSLTHNPIYHVFAPLIAEFNPPGQKTVMSVCPEAKSMTLLRLQTLIAFLSRTLVPQIGKGGQTHGFVVRGIEFEPGNRTKTQIQTGIETDFGVNGSIALGHHAHRKGTMTPYDIVLQKIRHIGSAILMSIKTARLLGDADITVG